jgi:2-polyprenyl-3-methyl-5-hydroxy-6-metoxy-1,4-benzoquinol methylase
METFNRKKHWENIYHTKELKELSWFEPLPFTSIELIEKTAKNKDSKIIDVGGGDSFVVDHLLKKGYTNVTVLDVSALAIERAQKRLGLKAKLVKWIIADATEFAPAEKYDVWHDRAAFHFLTHEEEIKKYQESLYNGVQTGGSFIISTFSKNGPTKCSGIEIKQYSEATLTELFGNKFNKRECKTIDHITPFKTHQNFVFCVFEKK